MNIITEAQLMKQVPSVFSMQAHENTSSKYALIPTIECIRGLEKAGFYPVQAQESKCRNKDNKPFAKHMIRFRREGVLQVGGNVPEIVMINSHNGTSSYQIRAGIYRLVCANGLVVGNDMFYRSVRHQGDVISKVVESANEIIEIMPEAIEISEQWKGITLNHEQRKIYAESASLLKWDQGEIEVNAERLLLPRRQADTHNDLWTTFNAVQENVIRGGVRYYNSTSHKRGSTRAVNSVSENSRLNTALWNLTEKMANLATAA
jgi:Domain of unknown function (DUF932)